jgi:hypothetical protein
VTDAAVEAKDEDMELDALTIEVVPPKVAIAYPLSFVGNVIVAVLASVSVIF